LWKLDVLVSAIGTAAESYGRFLGSVKRKIKKGREIKVFCSE